MTKCDGCDYSNVTHKCGQCPMNLCNRCAENHRTSKYTTSHVLVKVQQERTGTTLAPNQERTGTTMAPMSAACMEHPECQITLFCSTCSNIYCQKCHPSTHRHKTNPIENCKLDLQKLCTEKLKYLFDKSSSLKSSETELLKIKDESLQNLAQLKKDLTNRKELVQDALEKEFSNSMLKIKEEENRIKNTSNDFAKNINKSADAVANLETKLMSVRNSDNAISLVCALRDFQVDNSEIDQSSTRNMSQTLGNTATGVLETKAEIGSALASVKQVVAVKEQKGFDPTPSLRLCRLARLVESDDYGFNLTAEKGETGQLITHLVQGSSAEMAGLKHGDKVIEVNGTKVSADTHSQVVQRIKSNPHMVELLVLDPYGVKYYADKKMNASSKMANVEIIECPTYTSYEAAYTD